MTSFCIQDDNDITLDFSWLPPSTELKEIAAHYNACIGVEPLEPSEDILRGSCKPVEVSLHRTFMYICKALKFTLSHIVLHPQPLVTRATVTLSIDGMHSTKNESYLFFQASSCSFKAYNDITLCDCRVSYYSPIYVHIQCHVDPC